MPEKESVSIRAGTENRNASTDLPCDTDEDSIPCSERSGKQGASRGKVSIKSLRVWLG